MTDWRDLAACKGSDLALFFPDRGNHNQAVQIEVAKAICEGCPVKEPCLDYAVAARETVGIWGGTTPAERGWRSHGRDRSKIA